MSRTNSPHQSLAGIAPSLPPVQQRPCQVRYLADLPPLGPQVLACVVHGGHADLDSDPRYISVDLPLLHGPAVELWESAEPVEQGWDGGIGYAANSSVLMGQLRVAASALDRADDAACSAYQRIEQFLQRRGYPVWLRVWNYIPQILQGSGDDERYRRFVAGRHRALSPAPGFESTLPAATAIGSRGAELLIYFLAARKPGLAVENPRQLSAYRYPRQYGPRSPSFSRAMLANWRPGPQLFVSGTASVVGHQTVHAGKPLRQLQESLANVQAVCDQAATLLASPEAVPWRAGVIKLYVRESADAAAAIAILEPLAAPGQLVVMHGDICRGDLSLEVEASYCAAPQ